LDRGLALATRRKVHRRKGAAQPSSRCCGAASKDQTFMHVAQQGTARAVSNPGPSGLRRRQATLRSRTRGPMFKPGWLRGNAAKWPKRGRSLRLGTWSFVRLCAACVPELTPAQNDLPVCSARRGDWPFETAPSLPERRQSAILSQTVIERPTSTAGGTLGRSSRTGYVGSKTMVCGLHSEGPTGYERRSEEVFGASAREGARHP
jgi:hypothetical protein